MTVPILTLTEAKTFIRVDHNGDDTLITSLILTASATLANRYRNWGV